MMKARYAWGLCAVFAVMLLPCRRSCGGVKVAVVKGWGAVSVFDELNSNWSSYGDIPVEIDTSLMSVESFTYADLEALAADVLWISNPAGGARRFGSAEAQAVADYAAAGHPVFGTFLVFDYADVDNRALGPVFGLPGNVDYEGEAPSNGSFDIVVEHAIFRDVPDPYVTGGFGEGQVPADDMTWDADDLGDAELLAATSDGVGVITWYSTDSYHAIYVSQMVEYEGSAIDTQFIYNALTVPEPATILLLGLGGLAFSRGRRYG